MASISFKAPPISANTVTKPSAIELQPAQTVPQLVFEAARKFADIPALIEGKRTILYRDLPAQGMKIAKALLAAGVQKGDRVAIWAPNSLDWVLCALGLQMSGAILVPINTRNKPIETLDILTRSGAKVLFSVGDFLQSDYAGQIAEQAPSTLEQVVVLTERAGRHYPNLQKLAEFVQGGEGICDQTVLTRIDEIQPDDIADLMFTSGTTGKPKGVESRHSACVTPYRQYVQTLGLRAGDKYLIINPFFHAFGYKAGWVASLIAGATILPEQVFDAETVLNRIEQEQITILPGPPTLYLSLLAHPRLSEYQLDSLRVAVTGSSSIPPALIERMRNELGITTVTTAYGLTECGGLATICDPSASADTIAMTSGKAIIGTELAILDADGREVVQGQNGEICLRGPHIMAGYFEDETATKEAIDAQGWLHTGDIGHVDGEGDLAITGRLKDLFIVGGFNCYPAEIEAALLEHPAINQAAVIGVPDERMGEVGCAFVMLKAKASLTEAELIQWSRQRMANYKVPRHVKVVASLPVNASNKVLKPELLQWFHKMEQPANPVEA